MAIVFQNCVPYFISTLAMFSLQRNFIKLFARLWFSFGSNISQTRITNFIRSESIRSVYVNLDKTTVK